MGTHFQHGTSETIGGSPKPAVGQLRALLSRELPAHVTEDHVQSVLMLRRGRERLFGQHLFSDPAWDILLELYAADLGQRTMSVSELALAADMSRSVLARWITALIDAGLVVTDASPDRACFSISLTKDAGQKMKRLIDRWSAAFLTF